MKLSNTDLLEEFFDLNKEKYPNLTIEQFKDICHNPWRFMKKEWENGELSEIRLKYFGVFQVYPGRAKMMLKNMKIRFDKKQLAPEEYFKYKQMLEEFLKKNEES